MGTVHGVALLECATTRIRRLFTAQVNPELRTVAALADALDADIRIIPRRRRRRDKSEPTPAGA